MPEVIKLDTVKVDVVKDKTGMSKDLVLMDIPEQAAVVEAAPVPEVPEQLEALAAEQSEPQEEVAAIEPVKETRNAQNFKALKAETARLAKERDEAKALLAQYEAEKKARQVTVATRPEYEPDEEINLEEDAYAEGKHVKALSKQIRDMKAQLEATKRRTDEAQVMESLRKKYADYDHVMTTENLKAFEALKPHIARSIDMSDPFASRETCYELIKTYGIDVDHEEVQKTEVTKKLIQQNLSKPKPGVASVGTKNTNESPMGRASEFYEGPLTDEMKKIFYKELKDAYSTLR